MTIGLAWYKWNTGVEWTEAWKGRLLLNCESSVDSIPIAEGSSAGVCASGGVGGCFVCFINIRRVTFLGLCWRWGETGCKKTS